MNDFLIQLLSNFFATIFAGLLLYWVLEKRVKDTIKEDKINRLLKNLAGDLLYNYVRAEKSLEKKVEYLNQDRFTLAKYHTEELLAFYYQKPLSETKKFPYTKLRGIIAKLEDNNALAELIFKSSDSTAIKENKVEYFENAEKAKATIVEFLKEIERFYKERGISLGEYS